MKCAITGSSGVLGKKITKLLPLKFYKFNGDIRNKKKVEQWILRKDFDILIHLAAIVPINKVNQNFQKAYDINVNGTQNLIEALKKKNNKPKWLFYSSTSHVYRLNKNFIKTSETDKLAPQNFYGQTKLLAEKLILKKLKNYKIKICIGRIFSFTDKFQKPPFVIPSLIKKIKFSKKKISLKNLNNFRDFLSTKDIVLAIRLLMKKKKTGIYNIGSGHIFSLKKIAYLLSVKYKKKIIFKDNIKPTYLISNNNKIKKLKWKPSEFNNQIEYFYK